MLTALTALLLTSSLYDVDCLERGKDVVRVRVTATHPDVDTVPTDLGFALSLLVDAAHARPEHFTLLREVSYEDLDDDAWLAANAKAFVSAVVAVPSKDPKVRELEITLTDSAWAPPSCGKTFESASFEHELTYSAASPRHPGRRPAPLPPGPEGFLIVPRSFFEPSDDSTTRFPLPAGPELLELPALGPASYASTPSSLAALVGRPALVRTKHDLWLGTVLGIDGRQFSFARVHDGTAGLMSLSAEEASVEALTYAPITGQRKRTSFLGMLARVPAVFGAPKPEGRRVTFTLRVPPDGRAPPDWNAARALTTLVDPVLDAFGAVKVPCPLATEIQRAMKAGRMERTQAITVLAPKLISKTSLVFERPSRDPRTVPPSGERAFLEQAWPKGTLVIEVSDPRWLSHLNAAPPRRLEPH